MSAVLSGGTYCRCESGWFFPVSPLDCAVDRVQRPESPYMALIVILDYDPLRKSDQPGVTGDYVLLGIFIIHKSAAINISQQDHHQAGSVVCNL